MHINGFPIRQTPPQASVIFLLRICIFLQNIMFSLTIYNATEYINSPARRPLLIPSRKGKKIFQSTMMCSAMSTTAHVHSHSHVLQGRTQHLLLRTRGEQHSVCWVRGWGGGSASRDLPGRTECQQRPRRGRQQDLEGGPRDGSHLLHRYSCASVRLQVANHPLCGYVSYAIAQYLDQ